MSITRRSAILGGAALLASGAQAAQIVLTPDDCGCFMRTRDGERVGPLEYDAASFGYADGKRWRGSVGWARAYYWESGRVIADEDGPHDIVGGWSA